MDSKCSECGEELHGIIDGYALSETRPIPTCVNTSCPKCPWDGISESGKIDSSLSKWHFLDDKDSNELVSMSPWIEHPEQVNFMHINDSEL